LNQCNTTDTHNHTHTKKRYLAVISHSTRFNEFNRKKNGNKNIQKVINRSSSPFPYFNLFASIFMQSYANSNLQVSIIYTVDSRYLEFDGTMEKIRVDRSSTQEELWKYRKCSLFNDERETTRAKFWRAKTSIACLDSRNDLKLIGCFCCRFFFC
jgi:hypothetical protein